jgi:hypothetical protein
VAVSSSQKPDLNGISQQRINAEANRNVQIMPVILGESVDDEVIGVSV